jgi:transcription termination factor Rho
MAEVSGILEFHPKGFGMLRNPQRNFDPSNNDVYVSPTFIQKLKLKPGLMITGKMGNVRDPNMMPPLAEIDTINGASVSDYFRIQDLRRQVVIDPQEQLLMQQNPRDKIGALIDTLTPIGRGQRGLIVAPPKTGKTIILKHLANSVLHNHADAHVFVLLVDERPEEVTDFQRNVNCPVLHSDVDQSIEHHIRITEMVLHMVVRMAECGKDVVLFVDSLTRMGRAYNTSSRGTGRTLTGGLDSRALEFPRRFFGSARNLENGGFAGYYCDNPY